MSGNGSDSHLVTTLDELEALYDKPFGGSLVKEIDHVNAHYRAFIEAAPFFAMATSGPDGLDCSPRGDGAGFVRIQDEKTLLLPDRRGNNRVDSLRNIVLDPRVALLFLVPGSGTTLRVNGRARLSVDPTLLDSFAVEEKAPRSVAVITVDAVYFQCSRAILRSDLWNAERHVDPKTLPSAGQILAALSQNRTGGDDYDRSWAGRAKQTL